MTPTTSRDALRRLDGDEVHLWWARPPGITAPATLDRCRQLLTREERDRVARFRFDADRHTALITRALVRRALSRYDDVPPEVWRFRAGAHGRPEIAEPASPLCFNLSHTRGLVVCLVGRRREVGVDVEAIRTGRPWLELASRFFAPAEATALRRLDAGEQPGRFLEYWTLKEAYVKARGLGVTIPLAQLAFELPAAAGSPVRVRFEPALGDDPLRWQFSVRRFGADHVLATVVERTGTAGAEILQHDATSLL